MPDRPPPPAPLASLQARAQAAAIDTAVVALPTVLIWALTLPALIGGARAERLADQTSAFIDASDASGLPALLEAALPVLIIVSVGGLLGAWLVAGLYQGIELARTGGRTIGKRAAGICVVRAGGEPVAYGWALWRALGAQRLLWLGPTILTLGAAQAVQYLWPLWDDQRRTLHDVIAHSLVVDDVERQR